jgi:arylsulfatase A-like enzyme
MSHSHSIPGFHLLVALLIFSHPHNLLAQSPPNVILIITDDQGYGDLGFHGNPHVQTPVLDQLAGESLRLNQFYVSPVCAPTRSSLLTGRYSLRTGVRDTYNGGATMATEEVTLAEILKDAGYRTGIFGKWHLGDNHPSRPQDQGFDESLIHLAGGMGQPGDFTTYFQMDSSYFDPVLWRNGEQKAYKGYCSDIFTDGALDFLAKGSDQPFFLYLSFNAPHTPLQVPQAYYEKYKDIDPASGFEGDPRPFLEMSEKDKEDARKVYGMVSNIDDNVGRLLQHVDELGLRENTIVIFMTDNGPQQRRYNAGMRGLKSHVFRGGIRVPFFIKWPEVLQGNKEINTPLAHIDVVPTLTEICQAKLPEDRVIDGKSFYALLKGDSTNSFDERPLFFYWTRKYPELYNNIAWQKGKYKLVGRTGYDAPIENFELYDINKDEFELHNIVHDHLSLAMKMKDEMDQMLQELLDSPHLTNPPKVAIGTGHENPVFLNRNDAGGQRGIWTQEEAHGSWKVSISEGMYKLRFKFIRPIQGRGKMLLEANHQIYQTATIDMDGDTLEMDEVYFTDMETDLIPHFEIGGKHIFPLWVEIERL